MNQIEAGGKLFNIRWVTGVVAGQNKLATTHVSGSGTVREGHGSMSISSSTTVHNDIFLVDEHGKEHSFQLSDFNVACREGNKLSVVWAILDGKQTGSYVLVINHDTRDNCFSSDMVIGALYDHPMHKYFSNMGAGKKLAMGCLLPIMIFVAIILFSAIAVVIFSFFGGFIKLIFTGIIIGSIVWAYKKFKNFKAESEEYVRQFKSKILELKYL